jgi:hypothetical protein
LMRVDWKMRPVRRRAPEGDQNDWAGDSGERRPGATGGWKGLELASLMEAGADEVVDVVSVSTVLVDCGRLIVLNEKGREGEVWKVKERVVENEGGARRKRGGKDARRSCRNPSRQHGTGSLSTSPFD